VPFFPQEPLLSGKTGATTATMLSRMRRHVAIVGGGVIGLSTAYYCAKAGYAVTVIDRNPPARNGCSFGNAGMVVPSHFIPLAAPGMVALGLKWMWNPESPFYIRPRFDPQLFEWGWRFWRASTAERVQKAAPLLRDIERPMGQRIPFRPAPEFERLAPRVEPPRNPMQDLMRSMLGLGGGGGGGGGGAGGGGGNPRMLPGRSRTN
jgi:glycine/D-amino acid oxidase-like deaminating enzyme